MYPTKWTGIHFTNITHDSYMKIPPIEGYEYKFYGYEELVELLKKFNAYDPNYFIEKYCKPLLIHTNTPPVLVLEKHTYEKKSETNFTGPGKLPVQTTIVYNDRNKIKDYFKKIRLLTGDEIFITGSYNFDEQRGVKMSFGGAMIGTEVRDTVETDITDRVDDLVNCLEDIELPMSKSFIEGARKNLDYSYSYYFNGLAITMLITALETLLVKKDPIARALRNFVPKFYCRHNNDLELIKNEISDLYKLRCEIVHEGKFQKGTKDELTKVRRHVRKILLILNDLNLSKDEIIKLLKNDRVDLITKSCKKFDFI